MSTRDKPSRFLAGRTGAATIEFVLTIPLFLVALAFSFEFGQLFLAHQSTVNNARSAVRYLARTNLSFNDFQRANNIIRTGQATGGSSPDYLDDVCPAVLSCASIDDGNISVQIVVNYPLRLFRFIDGGQRTSIPFVVQENARWAGM